MPLDFLVAESKRSVLQFVGRVAGFLAVIVLAITVSVLPWMLGGIIPLANLTLLVGSILAGTLALISSLCQRQLNEAVPCVALPLVGLALLGTLQLRPGDSHPAMSMEHAVNPPVVAPDSPGGHTLSPADTRSTVATLLALALLSFAAFSLLKTPTAIVATSALLIVNSLMIAGLGMSQVFGAKEFGLNARWMLGWSHGKSTFAGFVNPNNAAGWLCVAVAVAGGWSIWFSKPSSTSPRLRRGRLRISLFGRLWQRSVEKLSELTVWQTLMFAATAFIAAGVAATQSRGGILALVVGVVVTVLARTSIRQLPLVALVLLVAGAASFGFLRWLDLDKEIVDEMRTLEDIGEASSIRVTHWLDTLHVVRDFPLTGTGLGSYRFANPAYQKHDPRVWFTYADNHYVNILVEGGITGLLLFVGIGACGLITGFAAWKRSSVKKLSKDREGTRVSRRLLAALGGAATLATMTQAAAAFFDYGVGYPATSAFLIVIIGGVAGFVIHNQPSPDFRETGALHVGSLPATGLQLALIVAASSFVIDQFNATQIDVAIVEGYRLINPPHSLVELDRLRAHRRVLGERLRKRPDDPEGLRLMCLLSAAEIRWKVVQSEEDLDFTDQKAFARTWDQATLRVFLRELRKQRQEDPKTGEAKRRDFQAAIADADLVETLSITQRRYPFTPELPMMFAAAAIANENSEELKRQVDLLRFTWPSKSDSLFETGALALLADQKGLTEKLWQDSLAASNYCRPFMLDTSSGYWSLPEALRLFGPPDYDAAVSAATKAPGIEQRAALWQRAEEFWSELEQPVPVDVALLRTTHLKSQYPDAVLPWLEKIIKVHSEHVPLIVQYAKHLEAVGRKKDSLAEWHRVQFLDPHNEAAQKAIAEYAEAVQEKR